MSKIEVNEIDAQSGSTITVGSACKSVAVPGNVLKTNAVQASDGGNIINQCGATITIGANDDTVVLGTGAAFGGGLGAVKWETTPQTGSFQATAGRGYFMNTTSGALTITTPASPSAGDIFAVSDYARTFQTNNLTVAPYSGAKIGGVAANATLSTEGQTATFVYIDGTQGWINTQETSNSVTGRSFITATGGTITECGNDKIHTFTGPGTFCVSQISSCAPENIVSYMVVAGGGSGGGHGGGGGAGGFREVKNPVTPYTASPLDGYPSAPNRVTITATAFPITVGAGGTAVNQGNLGIDGSNSVFSTITSAGGGGAGGDDSAGSVGRNGGSGGGAGYSGSPRSGGTGNTPPVSPPQGNNGGSNVASPNYGAGGGGGAGAVGGTGSPSTSGSGGAGTTSSINASPVTRTGGGGGTGNGPLTQGSGGSGGGGGGGPNGSNGTAGTANTGSGGGASGGTTPCTGIYSGAGGSGIVVIRYKFQ